jgi:crotonobetainyl-CoA:carnitine CoA-transferase CaiB-like acyl-CoA transferase
MLLADMGADVIKIESPMVGDPVRLTPPFADGDSLPFLSLNRNKRSLAVNYHKTEGKELIQALIKTGDVLIETFKPGYAARIGFDYSRVRELNKNIIYCSLSGYGQDGARARRSGHDINFAALSGILDLLRDARGRPVVPGFQISDVAGGALFAVVAILAALIERSKTGEGKHLDMSILDGSLTLLSWQLAILLTDVESLRDSTEYLAGALPGYNVYQTSDGYYMALGALEPMLWADFCKAINREDLIEYQFPNREDGERVISELERVFSSRSRSEWEAFFADKDLCCEPVLSLKEVRDNVLAKNTGQLVEFAHTNGKVINQIGLSSLASKDESWTHAPQLGEHTIQILDELGVSEKDVQTLRSKGVIATPRDVSPRRLRGLH